MVAAKEDFKKLLLETKQITFRYRFIGIIISSGELAVFIVFSTNHGMSTCVAWALYIMLIIGSSRSHCLFKHSSLSLLFAVFCLFFCRTRALVQESEKHYKDVIDVLKVCRPFFYMISKVCIFQLHFLL